MGDGEEHSRTALASELPRQSGSYAAEGLGTDPVELLQDVADEAVCGYIDLLAARGSACRGLCLVSQQPIYSGAAWPLGDEKVESRAPKVQRSGPTAERTVIQNPDVGLRKGGLEHEKASSGRWAERSAPNVERSGPTAKRKPESRPRSWREKQGLERE